MTDDIKNGMAFAFSSWSTYDNWLWGSRCHAEQCHSQNLYFMNIKIKTGGKSPSPSPTPTPSDDYKYGEKCS